MMYCSGMALPRYSGKGGQSSARTRNVPWRRSLLPRMPAWQDLVNAIHDRLPIGGLTHNFYKYPARFSPSFARHVILNFTEPGDLVLDPFMGAGTSLVEARVLGRRALGTDLNSLAVFLAEAKTRVLDGKQLRRVASWGKRLLPRLNLHKPVPRRQHWTDLGYHRNINGRATWRVRKLLEMSLARLDELHNDAERNFARCVLLRTGQWALDCREDIPPAEEIRQQFALFLDEMVLGAREFAAVAKQSGAPDAVCLCRSAIGMEQEQFIKNCGAPALVLTSPPYPGVHVLYHRWQVMGRKETPAPFWIAGTLDGAGASFYTFGDRKQKDLRRYYEQAALAFSSLARIATPRTMVVQMVAFNDSSWQLPAYLEMMESRGFVEKLFPQLANWRDGRVWRTVPNRKWYADKHGATGGSEEVVLFHRLGI
jgi:hypothetical protein